MKIKTAYVCQQCGQSFSKWSGKCQECNAWNSIVEEKEASFKSSASLSFSKEVPKTFSEVETVNISRITTDLKEWDRVLGGGLVPGSVILIGGEPGIGKSTLLLQAAYQYALQKQNVLYLSGEESTSQISLRASRLKINPDNIKVGAENNLERVLNYVDELQPKVVILDSIQTLFTEKLDSHPGSVSQIRECAFQIIDFCKPKNISVFLVGHITKEGTIAGPKLLEHMVDVVLSFEDNSSQLFRLLRTLKNRFGSTNELGVFEMTSLGLREVKNPSEIFLAEKKHTTPGSVITATMEGNRPILVEVQGLIAPTSLTFPRRTAIGIDGNRLSLLVAILEKRAGFRLFDQDVYVNIAGGLQLKETASDLSIMAALISSFQNKPIAGDVLFFGEVGLGGEVRSVPQPLLRLQEASRIGLKKAYLPTRISKEVAAQVSIELIPLNHIQELCDKI